MLFVIVGPTCSGKTSLAIQIADFFNAPIINADAFQIYQEMNVGTAKIPKESEHYRKHYLIDIVKPNETYSIKKYQEDFRQTYRELKKNHETIVVCGGSGLYIKAALYDYVFEDEEESDISDLEKMDNEQLYALLSELDYEAAKNIHINNRKRVIRAIQIARTHTINKSAAIEQQEHELFFKNEVVKFYFLNPNREQLYANINTRVEQMFEKGLVDEVENLLKKYQLSLTAKAAIGYKEVIDYLSHKFSLEDCKDIIKQRTRNYAKRQITFFKHQLPCLMFSDKNQIIEDVLKNE